MAGDTVKRRGERAATAALVLQALGAEGAKARPVHLSAVGVVRRVETEYPRMPQRGRDMVWARTPGMLRSLCRDGLARARPSGWWDRRRAYTITPAGARVAAYLRATWCDGCRAGTQAVRP